MKPIYDAKAKCFTVEASDVGVTAFGPRIFIEGVECTLVKLNRDADNDITHAEYKTAKGHKLVVFND